MLTAIRAAIVAGAFALAATPAAAQDMAADFEAFCVKPDGDVAATAAAVQAAGGWIEENTAEHDMAGFTGGRAWSRGDALAPDLLMVGEDASSLGIPGMTAVACILAVTDAETGAVTDAVLASTGARHVAGLSEPGTSAHAYLVTDGRRRVPPADMNEDGLIESLFRGELRIVFINETPGDFMLMLMRPRAAD